MSNMGGTRGALQNLVAAGFLTPDEADEVTELIDTITEFVELGAITRDEGDLLVQKMAMEKAEAYHERAFFGLKHTETTRQTESGHQRWQDPWQH